MGQRPKLLDFATDSERRDFIFGNPLGFRKNGRPIFLIAGGSGEDNDDDDDDDDDASGAATVSLRRFLKVQNRMKAADRRANAAEQRITELEEQAKKVPDLEKRVSSQEDTIKQLRIDNAFLTFGEVEWQDPEAALRLADLSKVTIADDGKVSGLEEALKELAEKKPFLVKPKDEGKGKKDADGDDEDEDDSDEEDAEDQDDKDAGASGTRVDGQNGSQGGGVSGTSTGSGKRKRGTKGPTDEELIRRYRI